MKLKNYSYLILLVLGISAVSCTDSTTENAGGDFSTRDTLFDSIPETVFTGVYDTLGYTFLVNSITEQEFSTIPSAKKTEDSLNATLCKETEGGCMELVEKYALSNYAAFVQRKGEELVLKLKNGTTKKFVNNKNEEDYEVYQFVNRTANGYFVLAVFYYESYEYLLVDEVSGNVGKTIGIPRNAPNNQQFAAGNYDMVAAFTFNGIHLASYTKDSIQSNALIDFQTWGPEEIVWKDDSTLYVKQKSQTGEELKEVTNYAAIRIRKNALQ